MAWSFFQRIGISHQWQLTEPTEAIYFRLKHEVFPAKGLLLLGQAQINEDESVDLFDIKYFEPGNEPEIVVFKKPPVFTERRIAFKRIIQEPSMESQLRRLLRSTLFINTSPKTSFASPIEWNIGIEVSEISDSSTDTSTPARNLYRATVLEDSPIGYWRLSESSETTAIDESGNNRNGTYKNNPTFGIPSATRDTTDKAVAFSGNSQDINFGNLTAFQLNVVSIEAWVKTSDAGTGLRGIFGKNGAFALLARDNILQAYNWNQNYILDSRINIASNAWRYLVLTYVEGTPNATKIYIDNQLVLQTASYTGYQDAPLTAGSLSSSGAYFTGSIDELAIYNKILTPERIALHYRAAIGD